MGTQRKTGLYRIDTWEHVRHVEDRIIWNRQFGTCQTCWTESRTADRHKTQIQVGNRKCNIRHLGNKAGGGLGGGREEGRWRLSSNVKDQLQRLLSLSSTSAQLLFYGARTML